MKHSQAVSRLSRMLDEMGLSVSATIQSKCVAYLEAVLEQNSRVNLTALTDAEAALRLHVLDSLAVVADLAGAPAGRLIDLGTGGGFPGVPLAFVSGRETILLDSVKKKVDAVEACLAPIRTLDEHIRAVWGRAETLASEEPAAAAAVVARAVAELPILAELAAPLLSRGGRLIAMKGDLTQEELARGDAAATIVGLSPGEVRTYQLPDGGENRAVVVFTKTGDPNVDLPRRPGMASKRPLA